MGHILLIHGNLDRMVPCACSTALAESASAAGAEVSMQIFHQAPCQGDDGSQGMQKHHLWEERWDVQELVLPWLRERCCGNHRVEVAGRQKETPAAEVPQRETAPVLQ